MNGEEGRSPRRRCANKGKGVETAKNAARERTRVKELREGFLKLQSLIPNVPPDTKLSKLDVLILATDYIRHLSRILEEDNDSQIQPEPDSKTTEQENTMKTSRESDYSNQTCDAVVVASDHDHLQREEGIKKPERKGRQQQQSPLRSGNIHKYLHPVKKWPMRRRLYAGLDDTVLVVEQKEMPSIHSLECPDTSLSDFPRTDEMDAAFYGSRADSVTFDEKESCSQTDTSTTACMVVLPSESAAASCLSSQMDSSSAGCASSASPSSSSPSSTSVTNTDWDSLLEVTLDDGTSLLVSSQSLLALDFHEFIQE